MSVFTLRPLSPDNIKEQKIAVLDIEAPSFKDADKFYMIGFYDGQTYTPYYSLSEFFKKILAHSYRGFRFIAHFGGGYDFLFFIDYFKQNDIHYTAISSGSRIIQIKIKIDNHAFYFWDSFSNMPQGLDKLGKLFLGKGKEEIDIKEFAKLSIEDQLKYNKRDCIMLYDVVKEFESYIHAIGGNMRVTLASTAMDIFRREYQLEKIESQSRDYDFVKESYKGGRVEIFRFDSENQSFLYDVNSFYPWAMCKNVPVAFANKFRHIKISQLYKFLEDDNYFFIARCKIIIKDVYIPPIPFSTNGKLIFPIGKFEGTFTSLELKKLYDLDIGEIKEIEMVYIWQTKPILKEYALHLYNKRKNSTNEAEKYILKILLNSLYGKFGTNPYKEVIKFGFDQICNIENCTEIAVEKELFLEKEYRYSDYTKVEIASCITARCRAELFNKLWNLSNNGKVYYCDTDSIITDQKLENSKELGELKEEYIIEKLNLILPKLYELKLKYPIKSTNGEEIFNIIKAKGFKKITDKEFKDIVNGLPVHFRHFKKFKEMIKSGGIPEQVDRSKRIHTIYDKRLIVGSDTKPIKLNEW